MSLNPDATRSPAERRRKSVLRTLWDILSSTTLSRCWPVVICTCIWSSLICFLNQYTQGKLSIQPTLVTVFGTVLGFVISFRTTSSFDRYNDGRRYWTQIVFNCRIFARTVWFHVPDNAVSVPSSPPSEEDKENKEKYEAMTVVEKTTAINLLLAYAVAIKHYLRGEDGILYKDLYPLVSYLPPCRHQFPAMIPPADLDYYKRKRIKEFTVSSNQASSLSAKSTLSDRFMRPTKGTEDTTTWSELESQTPAVCLDAELPPKHHWRSAFPFHLLHRAWKGVTKDIRDGEDKECCKNIPLEISLYLSSYISSLQSRGVLKDNDPILSMLISTLNALVDAFTELERVITTPIPVSYTSHLWMVTMVYCGALPFQTWSTFEWFTVPASVIASIVFFGFIVAGEEIENPFGYDKNDLNMGEFVEKIIRKELDAITGIKSPTEIKWVYSSRNDFIGNHAGSNSNVESPEDWVEKGKQAIIDALHRRGGTDGIAN